jgi:hypothetical protein
MSIQGFTQNFGYSRYLPPKPTTFLGSFPSMTIRAAHDSLCDFLLYPTYRESSMWHIRYRINLLTSYMIKLKDTRIAFTTINATM